MLSLFPWQLRSPNTRPQELGGSPEPSRGRSKVDLEIIRILGDAIGHVMFHPVPYEFGWIKLRGIPGEEMGMNTAMFFKESFDRPGIVRTAPVPEQHEPSFEMSQEVSQKSHDLGMPNVLQGMKTDVQSDSPSTSRNADRRDRRDLRPSSGNFKNRSLSDKSPGLSDSRDKTKSALVEEDQRDSKPFGLFLYAAMNGASNALFPFHPSPGLLSRASDSSSPFRSRATRYYWDDKRLETSFRSPWRFSGSSKDRSSIRSSRHHLQAPQLSFSSGTYLALRVVRERVLTSRPQLLFFHAPLSIGARNLLNNRLSWLLPTDSVLYPRAQRPVGASVQALFGFHGVSWKHNSAVNGVFLLLLRNSIVWVPCKNIFLNLRLKHLKPG